MKTAVLLVTLCIRCAAVYGDEGFLPPWEELKSLYRQSIEQEFIQKAAAPKAVPQVYSVDVAQYTLTMNAFGVQGNVMLSGTILTGDPEPIPLFGNEMAITEVQEIVGGAFLYLPDSAHLAFLPEENTNEFRATVAFLLPIQEENGIQEIRFTIPPSARNSLKITLPEEADFSETPGIADADGIFHFSARPELCVKYYKKQQTFAAPSAVIELDALACIRIEKNRLFVTAHYQPMRPAPETLALHVPSGTNYIASSLNANRLNKTAEDQYTISFPESEQQPFSIDFALEGWADKGEVSLTLPFIENNTGTEGRFVVEEPDEGQVKVEAEGMSASIPTEKLGEILAAKVHKNLFYMKAPIESPIQLTYKPFQTVSTPATVLASQSLFVSFGENGAVLSVLQLEVPPEMGARMTIKAIEGMEIWSLTVNEMKQSVYTDDDNSWIIPLDGAQPSRVALAFLSHGPKRALQGALDVVMPETGLPSREVRVGIALPPRVNLLSLEGAVSPATGEHWETPEEFVGNPHFFSRSFYKGEGMTLSIAYKEPINQNQ